MLCFPPPLLTSATAQYPIIRKRLRRTIANRAADGSEIKVADTAAVAVDWELVFSGLTNAEWLAIEQFFGAVEGRTISFTFLDSGDNLLRWSEDLSNSVWLRDPMLQLSPGVADPLGTSRASLLTNTGQAPQSIRQVIAAPANYPYCFSAFVRSAAAGEVTLLRGGEAKRVTVATNWQQVFSSGTAAESGDSIAFGIEAPAGATVEVFGLQAEAQPAPSGYKRTLSRAGVYSSARFANDALWVTAEGPDNYRTSISLLSRE